MATFLKAQVSSLIASAVDFLITALIVNFFGLWYVIASILGTVSGGLMNFSINRDWVFQAGAQNIKPQLFNYILVWFGNLILVTTGVYFLTHFFNLNYLFSKIATSIVVGISYNYFMQKQFIFSIK